MNRKVLVVLCAAIACIALPWAKTNASAADNPGQFHSRGVIRYQDAGGQQVILDAGDIDRLFQYAAEGKRGLSGALSGVGTKLIKGDAGYSYTRDPQTETSAWEISTADEMREADFDLLIRALEESQMLPGGYEGTYVLANSDNLTLGRSAWSDGSLLRGNNRDLTEHYIRGWLEGSGCRNYEAIYNEEGRWIGYREKK
ncbi:MAG: hypothetical protein K2J99_06670 [Lachnospiraceae bacterium]|nr:hypothetical protein [Lachnospiraceae bacterium]